MTKKYFFIIIVAFALFFTLAGCADGNTPALGRYYLVGSDTVFIEILESNKIIFYNVDFSGLEVGLLEEINIAENIGDRFDINESLNRIFVEIVDMYWEGWQVVIHLDYSASEQTLTLKDMVFRRNN